MRRASQVLQNQPGTRPPPSKKRRRRLAPSRLSAALDVARLSFLSIPLLLHFLLPYFGYSPSFPLFQKVRLWQLVKHPLDFTDAEDANTA